MSTESQEARIKRENAERRTLAMLAAEKFLNDAKALDDPWGDFDESE